MSVLFRAATLYLLFCFFAFLNVFSSCLPVEAGVAAMYLVLYPVGKVAMHIWLAQVLLTIWDEC